VIFVLQVRHGVASSRHSVFVTCPMRFHANFAVVWLVGLAGRFVMRAPIVEIDGLPVGWADAAGARTNAAAAARAARSAGMRREKPGKRMSTTGGSENSASHIGV